MKVRIKQPGMKKSWSALLMLLALTGCTPPQPASVAVNEKLAAITTTVEAAEAQNLAGIQAEPIWSDSTAIVVVPDEYRMQALVRSAFRGRLIAENVVEALAKLDVGSLNTQANALVRSQMFGTISVTTLNDTTNPDIGTANYLVWYQVRSLTPDDSGPWVGHWYVRHAGDTRVFGAFVDPGTPPGTPRLESFVHSVKRAVDHLNASSASDEPRTPT